MTFFSFSVVVVIVSSVVIQYTRVYSATARAQMLSDVIADSSTVGADNGFAVVYSSKAKKTPSVKKIKNTITKLNTNTGTDTQNLIKKEKDTVSVSVMQAGKSSGGVTQSKLNIQGKDVVNAVRAEAVYSIKGVRGNVLSPDYQVKREAASLLSEQTAGARIALYALAFSDYPETHPQSELGQSLVRKYNHNRPVSAASGNSRTRTRYIFGAGRGGGDDWQDYTDCSGFVAGVYSHFMDDTGKPYSFTAWTGSLQLVGKTVYSGGTGKSDAEWDKILQPGDIICYWNSASGGGVSDHVGIYVAHGYEVDCSGGSQCHDYKTVGYGGRFRKISSTGFGHIQVQRVIRDISGMQYKDHKGAYINAQSGQEAGRWIFSALKSEFGLSDIQAAAMLGCFAGESGSYQALAYKPYICEGGNDAASRWYTAQIDAGRISKAQFVASTPVHTPYGTINKPGYGLCQWTSPNRKALMWDIWMSMGGPKSNISIGSTEVAISTAVSELSGAYSGVIRQVKGTSDIAGATFAMLKGFEGIVDASYPYRVQAAVAAFNQYKTGGVGSYVDRKETAKAVQTVMKNVAAGDNSAAEASVTDPSQTPDMEQAAVTTKTMTATLKNGSKLSIPKGSSVLVSKSGTSGGYSIVLPDGSMMSVSETSVSVEN